MPPSHQAEDIKGILEGRANQMRNACHYCLNEFLLVHDRVNVVLIYLSDLRASILIETE